MNLSIRGLTTGQNSQSMLFIYLSRENQLPQESIQCSVLTFLCSRTAMWSYSVFVSYCEGTKKSQDYAYVKKIHVLVVQYDFVLTLGLDCTLKYVVFAPSVR